MPWSGSWQWWRGNEDLKHGKALAAINHYNLSLKMLGTDDGLLQNIVIARLHLAADAEKKGDLPAAESAAADLQKADDALNSYKSLHGKSTPEDIAPSGESDSGALKARRK
jgi:hypothetical protein